MTKRPPPRQATRRRAQVLQLLRGVNEPLGIAEIADRLGIHVNTVRFHLDTLVDNGQVERTRADAGGPGRPPQLYRAVRGMDPAGPRRFRVLAEVLVGSLAADPDPGGRGLEAGRRWGRLQASSVADSGEVDKPAETAESVDRLIGMLDELGFAPEQNDGGVGSQIGLRNCPFLELAVDGSGVVCPVHLGLMQGAMQAWDSPVTVDRLVPFVEPDLCMVHLGSADSAVDPRLAG